MLEKALPTLPTEPIAWICRFDDTREFDPTTAVPSREVARELLEISTEPNIIRVRVKDGFLLSFRQPTNIGESLLVESLVRGAFSLAGTALSPEILDDAMTKIVPDEWSRDIHFFVAREYRDFIRHSVSVDPILISEEDAAYACLGLGWRVRSRAEGPRIYGIELCCNFLSKVINSIWEEVRTELKKYTRAPLILNLIENHEATMMETDQWLRTAKAVRSLHNDKELAARESAMHIAKLNASSLGTRLLIEIAICECPESGGIEAGELDTSRLLANAMRMHHLGGWSEAIRYEGKQAEVRITPLGDVHTHVDFDQKIATPYGVALGMKRLGHGAKSYEKNFQENVIRGSTEDAFASEFWEAWVETFGFSIDELRRFLENIDDEGVRRSAFAFTCTFDELCSLGKTNKLATPTIRHILNALALYPRENWAATPTGFSPKDWYPWRYRRRLSIISRPIIQLSNDTNTHYIVAPGMVRNGALKVVQYCMEGGYDARDFPSGKMRSWIGAAENKRGHEFNQKVSNRLRELGWQTKSDVKLTEILNRGLDRDYGDVDVLAWKGERILAIECKDMELAMTAGDVARQVYEFRGEDRSNGKPDRLKKHLTRIATLKVRMDRVRRYTRSGETSEIEACLVFSDIVPMTFSETANQRGVKIFIFDDLASI